MLDLSNFSWGGEGLGVDLSAKSTDGVRCGEGLGGSAPSPEFFLVFDLEMVNFGVF